MEDGQLLSDDFGSPASFHVSSKILHQSFLSARLPRHHLSVQDSWLLKVDRLQLAQEGNSVASKSPVCRIQRHTLLQESRWRDAADVIRSTALVVESLVATELVSTSTQRSGYLEFLTI